MDEDLDDEDDEDGSGSSDDSKHDPDYHPVQFVWKFDRRFVNYVIAFRPEKHGKGFRYVASEWRKKFLNLNGIKPPGKCTFVYEPNVGKLIMKKVSN
ncbi:hypothetical protein Hanom_Chr11g01034831 [Helianthus anomalus]